MLVVEKVNYCPIVARFWHLFQGILARSLTWVLVEQMTVRIVAVTNSIASAIHQHSWFCCLKSEIEWLKINKMVGSNFKCIVVSPSLPLPCTARQRDYWFYSRSAYILFDIENLFKFNFVAIGAMTIDVQILVWLCLFFDHEPIKLLATATHIYAQQIRISA